MSESLKICKVCKIEKTNDCFSVVDKKRHPNTLRTACKACRSLINRNYKDKRVYQKKAIIKKFIKLSLEERRIRVNAANKRWREENKEKWKLLNKINRHNRRALESINSTEWIAKVNMLQNKCQICFKTEPEVKITIDHIHPISKGGTNHIDNLQPLCLKCNQSKYNKIINRIEAPQTLTI